MIAKKPQGIHWSNSIVHVKIMVFTIIIKASAPFARWNANPALYTILLRWLRFSNVLKILILSLYIKMI